MNSAIKTLLDRISKTKEEQRHAIDLLEVKLQAACSKYFDTNEDVRAIVALQDTNPDGYQIDQYGDLEAWYRIKVDLKQFEPIKDYLQAYILDSIPSSRIDFENDALLTYLGNDFISIQDDTRPRDNGVWHGRKMIIPESDYRDEDTNEVNKVKRNELIEAYMERSGYYPEVVRVTQYGDVYLVNTKVKG